MKYKEIFLIVVLFIFGFDLNEGECIKKNIVKFGKYNSDIEMFDVPPNCSYRVIGESILLCNNGISMEEIINEAVKMGADGIISGESCKSRSKTVLFIKFVSSGYG